MQNKKNLVLKKILILILLCNPTFFVKAQSISDYIEQYAPKAQELSATHHIPASVILAVAIHESAAGKSKIAQYLNNHFGFKGKNSSTEIKSAYRDFPSVDSSYNYFITFLKSRPHFNRLFEQLNAYHFSAWVRGLQKGGYARSKTWANQVTSIIKKYKLYEFDNRPEDYIEPKEVPAKSNLSENYTVKKGDNLSIIAKRFKTTVKILKSKNNLKSDFLQIGQKLKL